MIAPVYEPNAIGRYVYIPEDMIAVHFKGENNYTIDKYKIGHYFVEIPNDEVVVFIRKNKVLPLVDSADCTAHLDFSTLRFIGEIENTFQYTLCTENGVSNGESTISKTDYKISGSSTEGTINFMKL